MNEEQLFQRSPSDPRIDIFLGEWACDIPFGGGEVEHVSISLTDDSPKSHHHIPVLRLHAGHQMDFEAHEQTPAGHAAMLVATWLNSHEIDGNIRYAAELFLWQWSGIRQLDDGSWHLSDISTYEAQLDNKLVDIQGNYVLENAHEFTKFQEHLRHNLNLQVHPYGFCRKTSPCFLLDACLLCPYFATNVHFVAALQKRSHELQNKSIEAVANNNQRLANSCHKTRMNLESFIVNLGAMSNKEEENTHE